MPPKSESRRVRCEFCVHSKLVDTDEKYGPECTIGEQPYTVVRDGNFRAHVEPCEMYEEVT